MAHLYADEDWSFPTIHRLRRLGDDILTAHEAGQAGRGITDDAVVTYAMMTGRVVVISKHRRFIRLHAEVPSHTGLIVCTRDDDVAALADRIHRQLLSMPTLQGQLLRITRPSPEHAGRTGGSYSGQS